MNSNPRLFFAGLLRASTLAMLFVAGVMISINLWEYLRLPFSNPENIAGPLAALQFNPANNQIRFAVFVFLPSVFLALVYKFNLLRTSGLFSSPASESVVEEPVAATNPAGSKWSGIGLVIFSILVAWNTNTYLCSGRFDMFHEGESLASATAMSHGMKPYRDFRINHGMFEDPVRTLVAFRC
ncbi:MAG: hypothetical protein WCG06_06790, partial [Candidatus Omnitrophota bacterium]